MCKTSSHFCKQTRNLLRNFKDENQLINTGPSVVDQETWQAIMQKAIQFDKVTKNCEPQQQQRMVELKQDP